MSSASRPKSLRLTTFSPITIRSRCARAPVWRALVALIRQRHDLAGAADLAQYADLYIRTFNYLYGGGPERNLYLEAPLVPIPPAPRHLVGAGCYP